MYAPTGRAFGFATLCAYTLVPWERVHKIILRPGDPWAQLLLKPADGRPFEADLDADKRQLMGIQTVDGPLATAAVNELRVRHRRFLEDRCHLTTDNSGYSMPRDLSSASISAISSSIGGCSPRRLARAFLGWQGVGC